MPGQHVKYEGVNVRTRDQTVLEALRYGIGAAESQGTYCTISPTSIMARI